MIGFASAQELLRVGLDGVCADMAAVLSENP